jgi:hypothetical protein
MSDRQSRPSKPKVSQTKTARVIKYPCHASPAARQRALIRFEEDNRQRAGDAGKRRTGLKSSIFFLSLNNLQK